ncbi:hypothetical protein ABFS83_02G097200 [Erythranthe nasuta]
MKSIPYASAVRSLMYAQTCTRPDISYAVGVLGRYPIIDYTDSDFASCVDCRKSTSRFVFLLAGGTIAWKSLKQSIIDSSTMEVEFEACFEASRLKAVDPIAKPLMIYCDNTAAVFFSKIGKYSSGSKHMDLKYLVVKLRVHKQQVSIENLNTTFMIADPVTKGLPVKTYE